MELKDFNREVYVGYEITRNCNMRCSYCYVRTTDAGDELTLEDWRRLTDILVDRYRGFDLSFHLAGGEIFVKPGVEDLMAQIIDRGCPVSVVSNGLRIPAAVFDDPRFKRRQGMFHLAVSLDGLESQHEIARSGFRRVFTHFERLIAHGVDTSVKATAHRQNLEELLPFTEEINRIGAKHGVVLRVEVQPLSVGTRAEIRKEVPGLADLGLELRDYLAAGLAATRHARAELPFVDHAWRFVGAVGAVGDGRDQRLSFNSAYFGCAVGNGFDVMASGDIVACEMDLPLGNVTSEPPGHGADESHDSGGRRIDSAKVGEILSALEQKTQPSTVCLRCEYKYSCGMCRLTPHMHGYTEAFGYQDCQEFMRDINLFYEDDARD